jgi:hypothetical protein
LDAGFGRRSLLAFFHISVSAGRRLVRLIKARKNEAITIADNKPLRRFSSQHIKLAAQRHNLRLERIA